MTLSFATPREKRGGGAGGQATKYIKEREREREREAGSSDGRAVRPHQAARAEECVRTITSWLIFRQHYSYSFATG